MTTKHDLGMEVFAAKDEIDRLREQKAELCAALTVFARIPLEEFSIQHHPERPLFGFNLHTVYVRDVLQARAALAKTTT